MLGLRGDLHISQSIKEINKIKQNKTKQKTGGRGRGRQREERGNEREEKGKEGYAMLCSCAYCMAVS